jgi:hypothetical protein
MYLKIIKSAIISFFYHARSLHISSMIIIPRTRRLPAHLLQVYRPLYRPLPIPPQHDLGLGGRGLDVPVADLVLPEAGHKKRRFVAKVALCGEVLGWARAQVSPRGRQRGHHLVEEVVGLLRPAPSHLTATRLHGVG